MKNQRDENGEKHGLWERYYSDGKLWYKGSYKNGREIGLWEYYYYDGRLWCKGAVNRGNKIGLFYELNS